MFWCFLYVLVGKWEMVPAFVNGEDLKEVAVVSAENKREGVKKHVYLTVRLTQLTQFFPL